MTKHLPCSLSPSMHIEKYREVYDGTLEDMSMIVVLNRVDGHLVLPVNVDNRFKPLSYTPHNSYTTRLRQ